MDRPSIRPGWPSQARPSSAGAETHEPIRGRRYFWLKPNDRYCDPKGPYRSGCPIEAIDPLTLAPDQPGARPRRS
ncbi:MAG: DUF6009 family protein [Candidatus Limnocylindrales bacterium]